MTVEVNTTIGEVIFKEQSEIEALALAVNGTTENIFYEEDPDSSPRPAEIPIGSNIILEYDNKHFRGWILKTLNSDCI
jgi:hypothetical protein